MTSSSVSTLCVSQSVAGRTRTRRQWSVVRNHKQTKCLPFKGGYHILRHSIKKLAPSQSLCISHLLKTHQSLDEAVLDTGPVLTHSKYGLICYGCTCRKSLHYLLFESNNAIFRLFSYCCWFDKC